MFTISIILIIVLLVLLNSEYETLDIPKEFAKCEGIISIKEKEKSYNTRYNYGDMYFN